MKHKTIKGSHFSNYRESWAANQTIIDGKVVPPLSAVFSLEETGEAVYQMHQNRHEGKIGILCAAPVEGLGVTNPALREKVGERRLTIFRRHDVVA
jgi:crotonyl-CoA reductase